MNLRNLRTAESKEYNIGLDIGTGSVGWAVTDANGELFHFKGKPTWGSRLFPTADTAAETRVDRGQRRRYDRRRQRLDLLQGVFQDEMAQCDPEFFCRLNQSRLHPEDRDSAHADYRWPLFNGTDFTERDYYAKFPTIYHLRAWLMTTDEKVDIRLIYLALHNIVKTRGNFLHQDNPKLSAKNASMKDSVARFCDAFTNWCDEEEIDFVAKPKLIQEALEDRSKSRADKKDNLVKALGLDKSLKPMAQCVANAIIGYQADFSKLFDIEAEGAKFSLDNDEAVENFASICPDEGAELFESLQAAYSSFVLMGILKGADGQTISHCKIREYDKYGEDLKTLKALVREYAPDRYNEFFRGPKYEAPYEKDYDVSKAKGYTRYNEKRAWSYDDFAKEVEKLLSKTDAKTDERYATMVQGFKEQTFLRRLKTSDNGSIPYQLHLEEMNAIIDNQGRHYPFLLKNRDKLNALVSFRIPYYVGPLTTKNAALDKRTGEKRFAWSVRKEGKEGVRVYPWNWEEIIDKHKSAEAFIQRMTGTCTYLLGEPVLPKCSLLYEKFCVFNELNGAKWSQDGDDWHRFDARDRLAIYEDLFCHGTVTYKKVEDWLKEKRGALNPHVNGGQGETKFESKLGSRIFFCKLLGVDDLSAADELMVENLIEWNTLFEDRSILKDEIKRAYGARLTDDQIKKICKKRFSGWGRLSKKFLTGITVPTDNGPKSIMDVLVEGNPNTDRRDDTLVLMQVIRDENLGFSEAIDKANERYLSGAGKMSIHEMPGSPALRRSVNQSLRIVDEIVRIAGCEPTNIYIEVAREDDEKKRGKRTRTRYNNLKEALDSLKAEGVANPDVMRYFKELDSKDLDERVTLYFMQNGKSLYSGKPLDFRKLSEYHVDHIVPQSYIKDDSLENKALILREENERKADSLLLDNSIRHKMANDWAALHKAKLIGDKKYRNLMRDHISDNQMKGFINRQIVETSQSIKFVRMMLADRYPDTNIKSVKAGLTSQLREREGFVKCREANNYHHAHDAFFACEIGRFIDYRHADVFDSPISVAHAMRKFIRQQSEQYRKTHKMPGGASFLVESFLTSGFDKETGEVFKDAWDADAELDKIERCLNYKQCYISRMPEETSGCFWDSTIYSPKGTSKDLSLPLKKGLDVHKYGSYSREQFAYFFVFEAIKKKKHVLEFAPVPVSVAAAVGSDKLALERYARSFAEKAGEEFVSIRRAKVLKYQLIECQGSRLYITGRKEVRNAQELSFTQAELDILARMSKRETTSEEEREAIFKTVCESLYRYTPRLFAILKLDTLENNYSGISEQSQDDVVTALLKISSAATNMINLKAIGGPSCAGCIRQSLGRELANGAVLIDQSVTGMFERRQKIEL